VFPKTLSLYSKLFFFSSHHQESLMHK
jgi:hypothetical protein